MGPRFQFGSNPDPAQDSILIPIPTVIQPGIPFHSRSFFPSGRGSERVPALTPPLPPFPHPTPPLAPPIFPGEDVWHRRYPWRGGGGEFPQFPFFWGGVPRPPGPRPYPSLFFPPPSKMALELLEPLRRGLPLGSSPWYFLLAIRLLALSLARGAWLGPPGDLVCDWATPNPPLPPPTPERRRLCLALCSAQVSPPIMAALGVSSLLLALLPITLHHLLRLHPSPHNTSDGDTRGSNMADEHDVGSSTGNMATRYHHVAAGHPDITSMAADNNMATGSFNMAARHHNMAAGPSKMATGHPNMAAGQPNMAARGFNMAANSTNMAAEVSMTNKTATSPSKMAAEATKMASGASKRAPGPALIIPLTQSRGASKMAAGWRAWLWAGSAAILALGEGAVLWTLIGHWGPWGTPIGCGVPPAPAPPCPPLACADPTPQAKMAAAVGVAASAAASLAAALGEVVRAAILARQPS
ncbi:uncharacterized protein [Heliangelus exortis]|uniref:uncharacterized protein n=1 Tax=Heliangelus exortis TaxID=472823 RepID=UPI003A90AAC7